MTAPDHQNHMRQALALAGEALSRGEFPVGCVLVHGGRVVAGGRRRNSRGRTANELDHAEMVALRELFANQPDIDRSRIVAYATMEPCLMCFAALLLNGIRTVVYAYEDVMGGGTSLALGQLPPLYRQMAAELQVIPGVLRDQSLALFKAFFQEPANSYWQGSPLADYTLAQP